MKRGDIMLYKATPGVWYEQLIARITGGPIGRKLALQADLWYNRRINIVDRSSASNTLRSEHNLSERSCYEYHSILKPALLQPSSCFPPDIWREAVMPIPKDPEKAAEWRRKQSEAHKGKPSPNKGKCYTPKDRIIKRFWDKVDMSGDCWVWTAYVSKQTGYGSFGRRHGETVCAHRMSWELTYGSIPDGLYVCHHCDNRRCVRPDHLFIGTATDNMKDCSAKGRIDCHNLAEFRKLTESQVREIRCLYSQGMHKVHIANRYHVHRNTIHSVLTGSTWKHVKDVPDDKEQS